MVNYLTVQDILWIHLQLCKRVEPFDYAKLEDATFLQYGYGRSVNLEEQAAKFLHGFSRHMPFENGNEAVAFVGAMAFLGINGREFALGDADGAKWAKECFDSASQAAHDVKTRCQTTHDHHEVPVKEAIEMVIERFPKTIKGLLGAVAASSR